MLLEARLLGLHRGVLDWTLFPVTRGSFLIATQVLPIYSS